MLGSAMRRRLGLALCLPLATAAVGCGGSSDETDNSSAAAPSLDADQVAKLESEVVSGNFAPDGCASHDITRFLSSPEEIKGQQNANEASAKAAPGHQVVTDDFVQIGVDTYKADPGCMQAIAHTLDQATTP